MREREPIRSIVIAALIAVGTVPLGSAIPAVAVATPSGDDASHCRYSLGHATDALYLPSRGARLDIGFRLVLLPPALATSCVDLSSNLPGNRVTSYAWPGIRLYDKSLFSLHCQLIV